MKITKETIISSIIEFNNHELPILKAALGTGAIYFPCTTIDGKTLFCLSKFCQFVGSTLPNYVGVLRRSALGGGAVRKMIEKELSQQWVDFEDAPTNLKQSFTLWISMFKPDYPLQKAKFIVLDAKGSDSISRKLSRVKQTTDELEVALELKRQIGILGETIAMRYEINRLEKLGCNKPSEYIQHISPIDVGAGYDILSNYRGKLRLIEVKATLNSGDCFYITSNELKVLEEAQSDSYIYIVRITDLKYGIGYVDREIHNAVSAIESIEPILFKVRF